MTAWNPAFEVIGRGMLALAFRAANPTGPRAIICAAGVADSRCADLGAFGRERDLLLELIGRARSSGSVLVYFSGAPVYGNAEGIRTESDRAAPTTPYGRHKLACEQLVADRTALCLVLRLPNIVGPTGNPSQLVPSLVSQALRGSMAIRTGASRDLLDVDDLVAIVSALVRQGPVPSPLNIASGISVPVSQMAETITSALDVAPAIDAVEGGDRQEFSTAAVRSVLSDYPRFEQDYPFQVLRHRVPSIERSLRQRAVV